MINPIWDIIEIVNLATSECVVWNFYNIITIEFY